LQPADAVSKFDARAYYDPAGDMIPMSSDATHAEEGENAGLVGS